MNLDSICAAASRHGLIARGGFMVDAGDDVPEVGGQAAHYLLLFGNAGSAMWEVFRHAAEYHDRQPDPLNRWSERVGGALAEAFGARALFPFGGGGVSRHHPFLRWAKKAETLQNSRLGMLIHPQFGLWHAYRFALAFPEPAGERVKLPPPAPAADLCRRCAAKPCRGACPVNAFSDAGYDVAACYRYLATHPESKCMGEGCQARVACPEGADYRYRAPHAAFHMRAFVRAMAAAEFSDRVDHTAAAPGAGESPA